MYEVSNQIAVNQTMHGQIMTCITKSSFVQRENTVAINSTRNFFLTFQKLAPFLSSGKEMPNLMGPLD